MIKVITPFLFFFLFSSQVFAKGYVFSVKLMTEIAQEVGSTMDFNEDPKAFINEVHKRIYDLYPELVVPPGEGEWIFNSVGGSLAEIKVLYCTATEYLSLWGSPIATEGFSGRYPDLDVWDIMLSGHMKSYKPGDHKYDVYVNNPKEGQHQTSFLPRTVGKHFSMNDGTYMIDYGRGNLLTALNSGAILGHKYVTGDKYSKKKMLGGCTKMMMENAGLKKRRIIRKYKASNPDFN